MKILVIGSGGREDAICWKLHQARHDVFCAPGNPGTARWATNVDIQVTKSQDLLRFAKNNKIELTVVGPEAPLWTGKGIVNIFQAARQRIFGPTKSAALIERSKAFAKKLMAAYQIPTAPYREFSICDEAVTNVHKRGGRCVIKVDGPAQGKGVYPCKTIEEAEDALEKIFHEHIHGAAGELVIIEDFLEGQEYSVHAICDKHNFITFPFARDHKRAMDGDTGSNTGGMGAIAPIHPNLLAPTLVKDDVIQPLKLALAEGGRTYRGMMFPGLMWTRNGPMVLEVNARFGDPETQVLLPLLENDLAELLGGSVDDALGRLKVQWNVGSAACVVMASEGYPDSPLKGESYPIEGIEDAEKLPNTVVHHCGTAIRDGQLVTNGGRVLVVRSFADSDYHAWKTVYEAVAKIDFKGKHFRKDIGKSWFDK